MNIGKIPVIAVLLVTLAVVGSACTTVESPDLGSMTFADDPLLGKVVWHDLITEDIVAARTFYGELFGWTFEAANSPRGKEYSVAKSGDIYVAGLVAIERPEDGTRFSRWLPYISVSDVDKAVNRSVAAGATVAVSARDVDLGRVAALIDPQGAVIGLARSALGDPDDRTTAAAPGRPVWNELLATDTETAASFYETLGGYDARVVDRRGGKYTLLGRDGTDRAGLMKKPAEDEPPVWLTFFGVTDPAVAAAKAESLGGSIILPAAPDLRGGTVAVVTDPSGAILVLQQWTASAGDD
jgi:predicted enzyme related to lactoylglutathione lyase